MALVIDLKPHEKVLIGDAVITNDEQRTRIHIEGDSPILRQKDVMQEDEADSPCKKIYFVVQCMYMARDPAPYRDTYFGMIDDVKAAAPSTSPYIASINDHINSNHYFKALKDAKKLIDYEAKLLASVQGGDAHVNQQQESAEAAGTQQVGSQQGKGG